MAVNVEVVAEKVFNLLAGNGYDISNLDSKGDKVIDPQDATRFVVVNPNILVRLDKATETLSMGVREDFDDDNLREAFKSLAGDYLMNFDYRIFGKQLKPKSETIDIAQKSEKNMGDVLEAINELRKLSGLSESDQLNEFQQFDPNVLDRAYDLLNKEQNKIYSRQGRSALLKTYSRGGRERLAKLLYKRGLTSDYRSSLALVNMYFDNSDIKSSVEHTGKPIEEDDDFVYASDLLYFDKDGKEIGYMDFDGYDNANSGHSEQELQAIAQKFNISPKDGKVVGYFDASDDEVDFSDDSNDETYPEGSIGVYIDSHSKEESIEEYDDRPSLDTDLPSDYFDKLAMVKKSIFTKYGKNERVQMIISRLNDEEKANGRKADPTNIMMKVSAHLGESAQWEKIEEGFSAMSGSTKTSYQGLDNVKLVIRHKKEVNEEVRGSRSRNISSIFVQRGDERFKMAENNLKAARAMARHVKNGGEPFDAVGSAINEMAVEQRKLREFIRYVKKSGLVNEDNESFVNLAVENINYITSAFTKLAGVKSYATAVEDVTDRRNTEVLQDDIDLESKFTETHFDDRVANVVDFVKSAMSRKTAYESYIDKAVSNESFAQLKNMLSEDDGMEFATPHAKLGYQVSQMSNSVNDPRLGNYLTGISKKLYSGDRMSQHEYTTIKSCLLGAHGTQSAPTSVAESVEDQYEKFIEQFDIL